MNWTKHTRSVGDIIIMTLVVLVLFEIGAYAALTANSARISVSDEKERPARHNISDEQWQWYKESAEIPVYDYKPFVGWQAREVDGDMITIDSNHRRVTGYEARYPDKPTLHVFGGSTVWGSGVSDDGAIPVILASKTGYNSINYGERGYNARQGLNRLILALNEVEEGDTVIFYDGVNDAIQNCRSDNTFDGHARTREIRDAVAKSSGDKWSADLADLFRHTNSYSLISLLTRKVGKNQQEAGSVIGSDCDDPERARAVAEFLVSSWGVAETILKSKGANFLCVLQPTPYSSTKFDPFYTSEVKATSARNVYPVIRELAEETGLTCYEDMSDAFEQDFYIDNCCHVTREGNDFLSGELKNLLLRREMITAE